MILAGLEVLELRLPRPPSAVYAFTELEKTALDRGRTYRISLTHDLDLDFQSLRAVAITYLHANFQSQQSVGSEDRVEKRTDRQTDGQTETIALPTSLMRGRQ